MYIYIYIYHQILSTSASSEARRPKRSPPRGWRPITAGKSFGQAGNEDTYLSWLVVGPPLWKMMDFVNWDDDINPIYFWENKIHGNQTTIPIFHTKETYLSISSSQRWLDELLRSRRWEKMGLSQAWKPIASHSLRSSSPLTSFDVYQMEYISTSTMFDAYFSSSLFPEFL